MMKSCVVYFSKFGNTEMVARVVAGTLETAGSVGLMSADQLRASALDGMDLVVMGMPTHKMNLPEAVRPVLASLPKGALKGAAIAAFDTSYEMSWWLNQFTAGKRLARKLRKLGGKQIVPPEIFLVTGREGPLFEGELKRASAWAESILETYGRFSETGGEAPATVIRIGKGLALR
jgi:flavodoxin